LDKVSIAKQAVRRKKQDERQTQRALDEGWGIEDNQIPNLKCQMANLLSSFVFGHAKQSDWTMLCLKM
jgi:hypothetical protein